jgi:hypothetical protein
MVVMVDEIKQSSDLEAKLVFILLNVSITSTNAAL